MGKVLSIMTPVRNPSRNLQESIRRVRSLMVKNQYGKWIPKNQVESFSATHNLCANIDYYKEYGRLPNNVDMDKIRGKGDAYKHYRGQ